MDNANNKAKIMNDYFSQEKICKKCGYEIEIIDNGLPTNFLMLCIDLTNKHDFINKESSKKEINMSIKFIETEENEDLTFGMVRENQFFVSKTGELLQKICSRSACQIAERNGDPSCFYDETWTDDSIIERILPHYSKIKF